MNAYLLSLDLLMIEECTKMLNEEEFMLGSRDGVFMFSTCGNLTIIAEAPALYIDWIVEQTSLSISEILTASIGVGCLFIRLQRLRTLFS